METWTLPDCSGSCLLMRESRTDTWRLSTIIRSQETKLRPCKQSGQCHSRESCCNNNNTIPSHNDGVSIYASSSEKTICKLFLGIESDTWLMCHATPVCCTVFPRAASGPLIGQCLARLASHWSRPSRQHALCLLETGTRLGQGKCFFLLFVLLSLICLSVNTTLIHPVKSHCGDSRGY